MELRGFPISEDLPSFPTWQDYYNYLQAYAKHFDILKYIQFLHNVVSVKRIDDKWRVKHVYVKTNEEFEEEYDYVIVGNGHFSKPNMPNITGEDRFKGKILHSHDYRDPEPFRNRRVLIVGAGPSGMDIAIDVGAIASRLVHSQHSLVKFRTKFPENFVKKPDVKEFNETGAIFTDGSFEELDDVIYCTGFLYDYPFLDDSCGLTLDPRSVVPLYRYMVNINQPSMVVMGLVVRACLVVALDAQARYATALIKGNFTLPPREVMMQEWQKRMDVVKARNLHAAYIHILGEHEDEYYAALTDEAGIDRVPPVMFKIRELDTEAKIENLYTYRNYEYTVIDKNTFTRQIEAKPFHRNVIGV